MPASCPQCNTYDGLTTLMKFDDETGKVSLDGRIQCENCGWIGETDELGDMDEDSDPPDEEVWFE